MTAFDKAWGIVKGAESFGAEDFNRKAVSIIDYPDSGERVTYQLSCGRNITVENDWFSGDAKEGLGEEWECFECMDSKGKGDSE